MCTTAVAAALAHSLSLSLRGSIRRAIAGVSFYGARQRAKRHSVRGRARAVIVFAMLCRFEAWHLACGCVYGRIPACVTFFARRCTEKNDLVVDNRGMNRESVQGFRGAVVVMLVFFCGVMICLGGWDVVTKDLSGGVFGCLLKNFWFVMI